MTAKARYAPHRAALAASVLLLTGAIAGCGASGGGSTSDGTGSLARQLAALTPQQLVSRIALTSGDLPGTPILSLLPGGDQVDGEVTLDNCGYDFTSEANRTARTQLEIKAATTVWTSNEVVAYDSAAHAAEALEQFRQSVRGCPAGTVARSTVADTPPLRYDSARLVTGVALPVDDNATASETVTEPSSRQRAYGLLILQRRGSILDIIYLNTEKSPPSLAWVAMAQKYAQAAGEKLIDNTPSA